MRPQDTPGRPAPPRQAVAGPRQAMAGPRQAMAGPRQVAEAELPVHNGADAASAAAVMAAEPAGAAVPASSSGRRDPVIWLIAGGVFACYTTISVFRYLRLDPTSWDLGIFTEYVSQYARLHAPVVDIRGAGFDLLGDHFHPIVALIAPFFRLFPSPITLLVAQALLAAVSVFPVS